MPKTLVEVDTFTPDIIVPEADDGMNHHADDLELFAQGLANRTHNLNIRAGKLAGDQAWAGSNIYTGNHEIHGTAFIDPDAADSPGIHIDRTSGDYQELITGRAGTASQDRVRVYSGANGNTQGAMYLVVNARWQAGIGWSQVVTNRASTALIIRHAEPGTLPDVRIVGKPAGAAAWAAWPQNTIGNFGATVLAEVLQGARVLAAGNTDADHTQGFRYASTVARTSPIPLGTIWGNVVINAAGQLVRDSTVTGEYDQAWVPIRIPPYCSFRTVRVHFYQLQSSQPDQWQLMRRVGAGGWVAQGGVETHGSYGEVTAALHGGGATQEVTDGQEWAYRWKVVSGDLAAIENRIIGCELDWTDIGPNNRAG